MFEKIPDYLNLIGALIISVVSGIASITRRISKGEAYNFLWITSEFLSAILCGYLMYSVYPTIQDDLPAWITLPVSVAVTAHIGGRLFQELEETVFKRLHRILKS